MQLSNHRFLVTGAAGFVGANLCHRLVQDSAEVHVLQRPGSAMWRLRGIEDRLRIHALDITDAKQVDRVVAQIRPTVIYHLATHGAYPHQNDPETILRTNVLGLMNLLMACGRVGYELFVNTGSSSEYGSKQYSMRENDMLDPNSFYAVAKSAQSLFCQHVGRTSDSPIVTLRLFSVYGPWEEPGRLIPKLLTAAIRGQPIDMVSPDTARDFVYVEDALAVYLEVEKLKLHHGEILNLGTGIQTNLAEVVQIVDELVGRKVDVRWGAMEPRPWDTDIWVADMSKFRRVLGFVPCVGIREGLARSLEWVRSHDDD